MKQGTVSSRVALLLRSAEVKPMFERFVQHHVELSLFFYHALTLGPVQLSCVLVNGCATQESNQLNPEATNPNPFFTDKKKISAACPPP
jgi:hypothetical protein